MANLADVQNKENCGTCDLNSLTSFSIVLLGLLGILYPASLRSAEIALSSDGIFISGKISSGDFKRFEQLAKKMKQLIPIDGVSKDRVKTRSKNTIVYLNSRGGRTWEGIQIGELIHRFDFDTYAYNGNCYSSCGLIWLAGKRRFVNPSAKVGFHASHDRNTRKASGNALIGVYLSRIGYSYRTADFVTKASPRNISHLPKRKSSHEGIAYQVKALPKFKALPLHVGTPRVDPRKNTLELADGSRYAGDHIDRIPHGSGKMIYADGSTYYGRWVKGGRQGFGIFTFVDGTKYTGNWKNDRRHGYGKQEKGHRRQYSFWENGNILHESTNAVSRPWVVQITSSASKGLASVYKDRIDNDYEHIIGKHQTYIDISSDRSTGLLKHAYKVRFQTFTRQHAQFICDELKEAGQTCVVLKK